MVFEKAAYQAESTLGSQMFLMMNRQATFSGKTLTLNLNATGPVLGSIGTQWTVGDTRVEWLLPRPE